MKVGIVTFHWATNYGAVLQAYALQTFLQEAGHDAFIINYVPRRLRTTFARCVITRKPWNVIENSRKLIKEAKIERFRRRHLRRSRLYGSLRELREDPPLGDAYICGSDQVWNPWFTEYGEGRLTLTYFLAFGGYDVRRVAYAASFGCGVFPTHLAEAIRPCLLRFTSVSVREASGRDIVQQHWAEWAEKVSVTLDPTLLLAPRKYDMLCCDARRKKMLRAVVGEESILFYVLHQKQQAASKLNAECRRVYGSKVREISDRCGAPVGVEGWLAEIRCASFVVTNSFHGVAFCVVFQKPFVALPVEGTKSGMNDRIHTLLEMLGLRDRMVDGDDWRTCERLKAAPINWVEVERATAAARHHAAAFISKALDT